MGPRLVGPWGQGVGVTLGVPEVHTGETLSLQLVEGEQGNVMKGDCRGQWDLDLTGSWAEMASLRFHGHQAPRGLPVPSPCPLGTKNWASPQVRQCLCSRRPFFSRWGGLGAISLQGYDQ